MTSIKDHQNGARPPIGIVKQDVCRALLFSSLPRSTLKMLDYWYKLKFDRGAPTTQLMTCVKNEVDRIMLGIVAMLDLEPSILKSQMSDEEWQFVDACHCYLRQAHRR